MNNELLYKYRSLQNYKNFIDIIMNKRLYAASYKELNDPMEGQYLYSNTGIAHRLSQSISDQKVGLRIVSLSLESDHPLMWSYYADGHRGVAIGVRVDREEYTVKKINYSNDYFSVDDVSSSSIKNTAINILSNKLKVWDYEKEERVFVDDGSKFAKVIVEKIVVGRSMSNQDFSFLSNVVDRIDPSIEIIRLRKEIDTSNY